MHVRDGEVTIAGLLHVHAIGLQLRYPNASSCRQLGELTSSMIKEKTRIAAERSADTTSPEIVDETDCELLRAIQ